MSLDANKEIGLLIDRWCERRDYKPLAVLLPSWLANNGLTDGWANLAIALHRIANMRDRLPDEERDLAKRLYVQVDAAVRR